MQNLKIRVNNEAESKEAQELFFHLGYEWLGSNRKYVCGRIGLIFTTVVHGRNIISLNDGNTYHFPNHKEITLPELRAMANPMNEYLEPLPNGEYKYHSNVSLVGGEWIEIPDGAETAVKVKDVIYFWESNCFTGGDHDKWIDMGKGYDVNWYIRSVVSASIIWQREQDEPFLTPETTLNDQYAEIEEVRQALKDNVNHPSHYADSAIECIDAMEAMMTPEQFIGYLRGNLFKYQWRYEKKNGIEDLEKARWYLEKLTEKVSEKNALF